MDVAAAELGTDPAELRRRNFVPEDAFPYETCVAVVYDSGDYERTMDHALDLVGYDDLRERQERLRAEGRYLGVGVANFVESAGLSPSKAAGQLGAVAGGWESSLVRFDMSGTVTVFAGTADQGQGHRTTYAQIVASELGVSLDQIEVVEGDTDQIPQGMGTYGSRSAPVGGGSIALAARDVREKARRIAAHKLEASADDLEFESGEFSVRGAPDRSIHIQEVAHEAYLGFDLPEGMSFSEGAGFPVQFLTAHNCLFEWGGLEEGDSVYAGERFGMIRFGSRVDVVVPENVSVEVSEGDRVRAGLSVLGHIPSGDRTVEPAETDREREVVAW
jgi:carbon-monoxide dehydrogenase large subunit